MLSTRGVTQIWEAEPACCLSQSGDISSQSPRCPSAEGQEEVSRCQAEGGEGSTPGACGAASSAAWRQQADTASAVVTNEQS